MHAAGDAVWAAREVSQTARDQLGGRREEEVQLAAMERYELIPASGLRMNQRILIEAKDGLPAISRCVQRGAAIWIKCHLNRHRY